MATNLRLSAGAADALRARAAQTGRSQQELLREAVDQYLGLTDLETEVDRTVAAGLVQPPTPLRQLSRISLPSGTSSLELLDRDADR